ncbi:MAG TPA: thioredoxin domain-containing protein, partial [Phototrophicaceae bacterium]|nr:thioredoxin domain-containing protein [Phototrophicaceae bacterium]
DGRPFYGGTYYPREPRHGLPAFRQILTGVHDAWTQRHDEVTQAANNLTETLDRSVLGIGGLESDITAELLDTAITNIGKDFDQAHGGFGGSPKFPQPMNLEFILRSYARTGDADTLHMVTYTLEKMARGGMYDQIGGGFARYSVDAVWLVPHFEKMLYDNAQLSRVYLHAWQATGNPFFKRIAEEIYDYILREMTSPEGGFYSATDADSEGVEGKFFVWTVAEIEDILGEDLAHTAVEYFGMTERGNFEGHNILFVPNDDEVVAKRLRTSVEDLHQALAEIKDKLFAARTHRIHPGLDDKILTAWNGLMLASLAEAARVLDRPDYRAATVRSGEFLTSQLMTSDYRLYRTHKNGQSKLNGYLEDYAALIDALLELYQTTFDEKWFTTARALADQVLMHFSAPEGGFFDTSGDHEALIVRPRSVQDNAVPSGSGKMTQVLVKLAAYTGDARYDEAARGTLRLLTNAIRQYPQVFGESAGAMELLVSGVREVAVVGDASQPATRELLDAIIKPYRPNTITALSTGNVEGDHVIPLLSYRTMRGSAPTVYVCRNFVCQMPVTGVDQVRDLLA